MLRLLGVFRSRYTAKHQQPPPEDFFAKHPPVEAWAHLQEPLSPRAAKERARERCAVFFSLSLIARQTRQVVKNARVKGCFLFGGREWRRRWHGFYPESTTSGANTAITLEGVGRTRLPSLYALSIQDFDSRASHAHSHFCPQHWLLCFLGLY